MSTFSGLNIAYTGLVAARMGLDVVGQNITNLTTEGYTRQRVSTSSAGPVSETGLLTGGVRAGQGVSVDAIARLGDLHLDGQVRRSAAASGYQSVRADTLSTLEASFQEPGQNGLSAQLHEFWAAWQDLSNVPGEPAPAGVLLSQAGVLATQTANGYQQVEDQWGQLRGNVDTMAAELNGAAAQVADLNARIRTTLAAGGSVNELLDRRSTLTTTIASLAGGTARDAGDGTVDVLIGGNAIVSGDSFRPVRLTGSYGLNTVSENPVRLEWVHRPGASVALDGGEIAGALSVLAPATGSGTGGILAEAAARYDAFAVNLADQVNAVHRTGSTATGSTGLDFFSFRPGISAAKGLTIVPQGVDGIATGAPGAGSRDGSVADTIAQLGVGDSSPDMFWASFVTTTGVAAKTASQHALLTELAATSAKSQQLSASSVDIDEENVNLLTYQHAYQGAARVMTAVDEMLDVLINRTGLVGR